MNELKIKIPEGIEITPEFRKRIQLAILPEIGEHHALSICEKYFGKKFILGKYNSIGFDVLSEDGTIIVEVKQTSSIMGNSKRLQIGSYKSKRNIMTHILILDYNSGRGLFWNMMTFLIKLNTMLIMLHGNGIVNII